MKKYLGIFAIVFGVFLPSFVSAQINRDSVSQIDCAIITHDLKLGSRNANTGGDVSILQTYLLQAGFLDSDPTGYFGKLTQQAVRDFQRANGISSVGTVGSITRAKIKKISCNTTSGTTQSDLNKIKIILPKYEVNGEEFIKGSVKNLPIDTSITWYIYISSYTASWGKYSSATVTNINPKFSVDSPRIIGQYYVWIVGKKSDETVVYSSYVPLKVINFYKKNTDAEQYCLNQGGTLYDDKRFFLEDGTIMKMCHVPVFPDGAECLVDSFYAKKCGQPIWKTYSNSKYGFEINLPIRWNDMQSEDIQDGVTFSLKRTSGGYGSVFSIRKFARQDWDKATKGNEPFFYTKISEKEGFVFGYSMGQDDEGYLGFPTVVPNAIYQGPYYDVKNLIIPTFKFTNQSTVTQNFENEYMKLSVPSGWLIKPVNKKTTVGTCVNKTNCTYKTKTEVDQSAVNITKGNYILYINTRAKQTSGIIGGLLGEILTGAPSYEALSNTNVANGCGDISVNVPSIINTSLGLSRVDLYVSPLASCNRVPEKNTWYASYFTDGVGFFNHTANMQAPDSYVITLSYNSKDMSKLPNEGSKELNIMLQEMTDIIATLQLK